MPEIVDPQPFESGVTVGTYSEYQQYGTFTADGTGTVTFEYVVPDSLDNGQHTIEAVGSDATGNLVVATTSILVMDSGGTFTDDDGNVHEPNIEAVAFHEVTLGCDGSGTLYCPNVGVTRAQIASFLVRALGLIPVGSGPFDDVTGIHTDNE